MSTELHNPSKRNFFKASAALLSILPLLTTEVLGKTRNNTKKALESGNLQSISGLSDEVFDEADTLLENIIIDPNKNFAIALIREQGSRIFGITINFADLEKVTKKGGVILKGILELHVKKGGDIDEIVIHGKKSGNLYRYGILGYKDDDGVTLLDESESMFFGKERELKPAESPIKGESEESTSVKPSNTIQKLTGKYRKPPIHLGYSARYPEKEISVSNLPDKESVKGRVIRSIRWKSITDAVEKKYRIPDGLLLAMMAQEGYGDPTLPNMNKDGGLGLIHIQAINAHEFGLKTLPRYTKKMKDRKHAREIDRVKEKHSNNLRELIGYDERFHPVMAVDVAARFLMEKYTRAKKKNPGVSEKELWNKALKLYSGRPYNGKRGYGAKVRAFQAVITTSSYIRGLHKIFPEYTKYMTHSTKMAENYGLSEYKKA